MQTKPRRLCFDLILLLLLLLCCYFSSMADPYGTGGACSPSHSPSSTSLPLESEDISTFLHHLLHNPSSASSSSCMSMKNRHMQSLMSLTTPPLFSSAHESNLTSELFDVKVSPEDRRGMDRFETRFESDCRIRDGNLAAGSSAVVVDSPLSFNFSDPGGYFASDARGDSRENVFSRVGALGTDAITCSAKRRNSQLENDSDGYGYDSEKGHEASDVPANPVPPRSSSKRSRAAEIHNLSEKRRRSRINEKMKALQNLIPNSNKTDKASMLDEAIEYLKQLQLQVQMLSMRNGLSLHPLYIPAGLQSMELPQTGTGFDDRNGLQNTNAGVGPIVADQDPSMRTGFDLSSHCHPSNQPIVMSTLTNITNPETSFGFEPVIEAQYGSFNLSTSSKEICGEDTLPELELDMSCFRKNNSPSPGVS